MSLPSKPARPILIGIGLTLYQLFLALFMIGGKPERLVRWDATWYRDIAANGYSVSFPLTRSAEGGSNISFFPAFPLWTRALLHSLPPITADGAVLLASWLAGIAAWAYFVLLLGRLSLRAQWRWAAILALLVQPGSFYMIAGYSEPLFAAALLGYVHWSTRAIEAPRRQPLLWLLAAAHGAVLSSTRILGVALVAYPLLLEAARALPRAPRPRQLAVPLALSAASLAGFGSFLAYCAVRWGQWDLYWEANRIGWNVYFDPWKLLTPSYYLDVFFVGNLSEVLGRVFTVLALAAASALAIRYWRGRQALPLALSILNLGLLLETIVGSHGMHSMVRYLIPIHALLIPVGAAWAQERADARLEQGRAPALGPRVAAALAGLWLFALQLMFLMRYSRNEWVS